MSSFSHHRGSPSVNPPAKKASSQLEALEGSQGVTSLTVSNEADGPGGTGNVFSGEGGGGVGGAGRAGGGGGGGGGGDDQAVASAFRILKVRRERVAGDNLLKQHGVESLVTRACLYSLLWPCGGGSRGNGRILISMREGWGDMGAETLWKVCL